MLTPRAAFLDPHFAGVYAAPHMKFAFSTVSCPKWDFDTIVARAKEYGYEGVEVRGFLNESILTASNPFLTDPRKLRALFDDNDLDICCLASSIAMTQNRKRDKAAAAELAQFIDTARALNCRLVKVFDTQVRTGVGQHGACAASNSALVGPDRGHYGSGIG